MSKKFFDAYRTRRAKTTDTPDDLVAGIWAGWDELSGSASVVYLSGDAGLQGWWARRRMQRESERRRAASLRPEVRRAVRRGPLLQLPGRECLLFATSSAELADPTWPGRAGIGVMAEAPELGPQIIARAGRASPTWQSGKLGVIWDAADRPAPFAGRVQVEEEQAEPQAPAVADGPRVEGIEAASASTAPIAISSDAANTASMSGASTAFMPTT